MAQAKLREPDFFEKAEDFINQNQKVISFSITGILLITAAIVGIKSFYLPSQEKEAQEQMFKAQMYFERDSFRLALNGDGNYLGFLDIMDEYSWTKAADLSNYYAGVSYLRMGQYEKAIDYLESFGGNDKIVSSMALGAIGDAYSELNKMDDAISYYKKAARHNPNNFTTPYYLFKAGMALKVQEKYGEALKLFEEIKNEYPESTQAADIDKYIAMVESKE